MSRTSSWVYDLQEKFGFTEDSKGNPIINWKISETTYSKKDSPNKLESKKNEHIRKTTKS